MRNKLLILLTLLGFSSPLRAQFIGYTSPQTVSSSFSNQACSGLFTQNVPNLGQAVHEVSVSETVGTEPVFVTIRASNDGLNFFNISNTGTPNNGGTGVATASGYYVIVQISVSCANAATRVSGSYSGTSVPLSQLFGDPDAASYAQTIWAGNQSAASTATQTVLSPYGTLGGNIQFVFATANGPANSSISIQCSAPGSVFGGVTPQVFSFPLTITSGLTQVFPIPAVPCKSILLTYTSGGASGSTISALYLFSKPGAQSAFPNIGTHITGTTATAVKATAGFVHTLTVNTGAAGTVSIFDLSLANCTGTPTTNTLAVITATATTLQTFSYDINTVNGICVKASVAMDLTVSTN